MNTWLFNPFTYIAGFKALVIGWVLILVTACIACYSKTHFDGAIDAHIGTAVVPFWHHIKEPFIDWGVTVLVFFATGKIFSASAIRFIDVAGTLAFARWPFLFVAILNFFAKGVKDVRHLTPLNYVVIFISLGFFAWMIALMYNAFMVSCNIKKPWLFAIALIIAEVLTKLILP
jgi:hypothetical protein